MQSDINVLLKKSILLLLMGGGVGLVMANLSEHG